MNEAGSITAAGARRRMIGASGRQLAGALLLGCALFAAPAAPAKPAFAVTDLSTHLEDGVYYLDADMRLDLNARARNAIENGVALTFVIRIHILHRRLWLWNAVVAHLTERYRLKYSPLTERYYIENLNSGARKSHATLEQALASISGIRHLPVIDAGLLESGVRYYVAVRAALDAKQLPGPLKVIARVVPGWHLESEWREERLTP